ncbi:MAG: serine hydrolase domain-containing protein [Thermomicrobiales bacterium]
MATRVLGRLDELTHTINEQMERWDVPGLAIGILDVGEVETRAFGQASIETRHPAAAETLFQIGSISKIFTTTLVMTLVDEGKVDLDTPVVEYVPELPLADKAARRAITLRNLVTHTGGFYGDRFDDHGYGDDALARAVAAFDTLKQQTAPGELWTYCNAGFDLAGRVVELVLSQRFEDAMRERVFDPLRMANTTYFAQEAIRHAVAVGHEPDEDGKLKISEPWPIPRRSNPAGGISSNVDELLRFARMHVQDGEVDGTRVLSEASAQAMRTKQVDADARGAWGLGWSLRTISETVIAEHNGATNGFTARLTTIPARGFALAILTNGSRGGSAHGAISSAALERFFGLTEDEPTPVEWDADRLVRFAGLYRQDLADLTLTVEDGGYRVAIRSTNPFDGQQRDRDPFRFVPIGDRLLLAKGGESDGGRADFILNPDGSARFLRFGGRLAYPAGADS